MSISRDSEDTVLLFLREIYALQGITISNCKSDSKVPNDTPIIQSPSPLPSPFEAPVYHNFSSSQGIFDAMNDQLPILDPASNISSEFVATSAIPTVTTNVQPVMDYSTPNTSAVLGTTENIGPPPLSGFVKRSPFMH